MEAAFDAIEEHGIGEAGANLRWYRLIEAETVSRRKSVQVKVNEWLTFEYVPREILDLHSSLIERALDACNEVAKRLDWDHSEQTLVSILAQETEADWAASPYGYWVHKEPYEKICLPNYLVDDPEEYSQAVAHEYAHVISAALSDGYSQRWLDEALSVLIERRFDEDTWQGFRDGSIPWLSAGDLEHTLEGQSEEEGTKDEVWNAYQQAGWIGRYLSERGDDTKLAALLRKVSDESPGWNIPRLFLGRDRVDAALRSIYGFGSRDLFARTLEWLRANPFS